MKNKNGETICVSPYDMAGAVDLFINTTCKSLHTPVCFKEEEKRFALSFYILKKNYTHFSNPPLVKNDFQESHYEICKV